MEYSLQAKEELFRDYHEKVLRYMKSKLNNADTAEDLTSDVFVKVYEKLDSFDASKASLSTWIFTVARNTLIDHFRTNRTTEEIPETLQDGFFVEEAVCRTELLDTLASALEALSERERDIIILRFYRGKTLTDIASQMGISYAYVKVLQNKAFAVLKKHLENH